MTVRKILCYNEKILTDIYVGGVIKWKDLLACGFRKKVLCAVF